MSTASTLIQSARFNEIGPIMATKRTPEAMRPFAPDDIPQAIALCAKPSTELSGVHRRIHDSPPLHSDLWSNHYTTE